MKRALTTATLMLMAGAGLMAYTVYALYGMPYLCAVVLAWTGFVEYAVARAWWTDVQDVRALARRSR
jgi:hypothetical protein